MQFGIILGLVIAAFIVTVSVIEIQTSIQEYKPDGFSPVQAVAAGFQDGTVIFVSLVFLVVIVQAIFTS